MKEFILLYIEFIKKAFQSKLGKYLWAIVIIKLFLMFFVLRLFFFPDLMKKNFRTDKERSSHVIEVLTKSKKLS